MIRVILPPIGTDVAWRDAARRLLSAEVPPSGIDWVEEGAETSLFAGEPLPKDVKEIAVPRTFVTLASTVCWHRDPERFALLYALLWSLRDTPALIADRADRDLARLRTMEKNVHRCQHKMKAFVRFRDIGSTQGGRRAFAAWFEPTHHTLEPTAPFFARRFGDMDWTIATPDVTAHFSDGHLSFAPGEPRPTLPDDAAEDLWRTYFRNIFNPARLKPEAMRSEMPRKYWKNLPEADQIADLIRTAPARAMEMAASAPSVPPLLREKVRPQIEARPEHWHFAPDDLTASIQTCTRCPLHCTATQAVPGEGPEDAPLMIVGEQPGDQEDLSGRPFVGPPGQLFDRIAKEAGLDRSAAYVTNAVKHFKFVARGKRRIHQSPTRTEIDHCRWWLKAEIDRAAPTLIVALGATAALSLTGKGDNILKRRGTLENGQDGRPVFLTVHPTSILRTVDPAARKSAEDHLRRDLMTVRDMLQHSADQIAPVPS